MKQLSRKQVVFILGTGYCGSTLVELVLGSHAKVFALGEISHLAYKFNNKKIDKFCRICEGECSFWDKKANKLIRDAYLLQPQNSLMRRLFNSPIKSLLNRHRNIYHYLFEWSNSDILIDSSKSIWWTKMQLKYNYHWRKMKPILIFVVRDGRAVVNSNLRKDRTKSIEQVTQTWVQQMRTLQDFYNSFQYSKATVQYEAFATSPASVVKDLCKLLKINFTDTMLEYWKHEHHVVSGNPGTRSLILQHNGLKSRTKDEFYAHDPSIRLDLRWKQELSTENLAYFQHYAGDFNKQFEWEE